MATKDYVYLALLAFSAIVFYLHGWYAGAQERAKAQETPAEPTSPPEVSIFVTRVDEMTTKSGRLAGQVTARTRISEAAVHCFFGNN